MALIAPGAFLWLTFQMQSLYGAPMAGSAMWFGILGALLLCFATAVSYAELSKLFPGAGSSYLYAEQAFLSKTHAYRFARVAKFFTGWASHLYYWVYPGCMVGVTAILAGYLASQFWPNTFSGTYNSPLFMVLFCIVFALGVGYIAFRGVNGSTGVNVAINIIQISALIVFSIIAIAYRTSHRRVRRRFIYPTGRPLITMLSRSMSWMTRTSRSRTPGRTARPRLMTRGSRFTSSRTGKWPRTTWTRTRTRMPRYWAL